jgi:hypothetical protein
VPPWCDGRRGGTGGRHGERGDVVDLAAASEPGGDGDDIVVIPDEISEGRSRRRSVWIVTAAGIALLALGVWALAARDGGTDTTRTSVVGPVINPASTRPVAKPKPKAAAPTTVAPTPTTAARAGTPKATNPNQPVASPRATAPPVVAPHDPAVPATSPISVLQWTSPTALTIATGNKQTVNVAAHNPSKGVVNLPHPLSCAPRLQHDEVCPEMVQMIAPGATARASIVVDATDVAPGSYTLSIEDARTMTVTVTK